MKLSIQKHKTPIAVTAAGLVTAIGLAIAPGIMAGSETDKRAEKNSAEIEKLEKRLASIDTSSADIQAQIDLISASSQGTLSSLGNQIQTLNKATTNLHLKQRSMQEPSGVIQSSISQLAKNSDARMINLEKAVVKLHRKQRELTNTEKSEQATTNTADTNNLDTRLVKLEETIDLLQISQSEKNGDSSEKYSQTDSMDASRNANDQADHDWRITTLERTVRQFVLNQKLVDTADSSRMELAIRKDIETDLKIKRLESSLAQLEMRIDGLGSANRQTNQVVERRYDPVVDQLFEIRNTVNSLLNEISR